MQKFIDELKKVMPGYKWKIDKISDNNFIMAIGTMASGSARISTMCVIKNRDGYKVKEAGYGRRAVWLREFESETLKQALRKLQKYYKEMATEYSNHACCVNNGRKIKSS